MTYISTTAWYKHIKTKENYMQLKSGLLEHGYKITRDYETATHFLRGSIEWILLKEF